MTSFGINFKMSVFYSQGDIVLVHFPYTDLENSKKRPALIISNSSVNGTADVTVLQLTTTEIEDVFKVKLNDSDLKKPIGASTMYAHCKKIAVMEKRIIIKKISSIAKPAKLKEIIEKTIATIDLENK